MVRRMGVREFFTSLRHLAGDRLPTGETGHLNQPFASLFELAGHVIEGLNGGPISSDAARFDAGCQIALRDAVESLGQLLHGLC